MADRSVSVRLRAEVDQYRRDMAAAAQSTQGVAQAAEQVGQQRGAWQRLGEVGRGVGQTLTAVATVAAAGMAAWTVSTIATGAAYNTLEQSSRAALNTLLGSVEAANEQMDRLREFARTSPFPRQVWIEAQQTLLAFGTSAERIVPTLSAIQDAVAAAGGSAVDIRELVRVLAQVQSTGKVTAETLNQLGTRGVDAAALIGQAMGKTAGEIREDISSGVLDASTFLTTLVDQMTARFGGAAEGLRSTWTGALDRIAGATRDIGSVIAEPFIDPRGGGALVKWGNDLADVLRAVEAALRPAVGVMRTEAEPALRRVSERLQTLAERIKQTDLVPWVQRLRDAGPVLAGFAAAATTAGGALMLRLIPGLDRLAGLANPLAAGLIAVAASSPEVRRELFRLLEAVAPLVGAAADLAGVFSPILSGALVALAQVLSPIVTVIGAVTSAFASLPQPVQAAVLALTAVSLLAPRIVAFGKAMGALPGLVQAGVGALRGASAGLSAVRLSLAGVVGALGGPWGLAIAGGITALSVFGAASRDARDRVQQLSAALWDNTGALRANAREIVASDEAVQDLLPEYAMWREHLRRTGQELPNLIDLLLGSEDATRQWQKVLEELGPELGGDALAAFIRQVEREIGVQQEAAELARLKAEEVQGGAGAAKDAADAEGEFAGELDNAARAAENARSKLKEYHDELRAQVDPMFRLTRAVQGLEKAQARYNEVLSDSEATQQDVRDAALDVAEAVLDVQGAAADATGTFDGELTPALRRTLEAGGLTEEQIKLVEEAFADATATGDRFAKVYEAEVKIRGVEEAERLVEGLLRDLRNIPETIRSTVIIGQSGTIPSGQPQIRDIGGPIFGPTGAPVPAIVHGGEHVWTADEVRAAGGHQAMEAMRAAVLGGTTRFSVGGPARTVPVMPPPQTVDLTPHEFVATAVLDIGDGVERVVDLRFRRLADQLMQGVGTAR